jgi:hypothetical protein
MINLNEKFVKPKSGNVPGIYMELARVAEKRWQVTESDLDRWSPSGNPAIDDLKKHFEFMSALYRKPSPILNREAEKYGLLAKEVDDPEVIAHLKYMETLCREIANKKR